MYRILSALFLLSLVLPFVGCSKKSALSTDNITVALPGPVTEWDWRLARDSNSMAVMDSLAPRLLTYSKNKSGKVQLGSGLVEQAHYKKTDGSFVLSLHLKRDQTWSDGKPLSAAHVKHSLELLQSKDLASSPCHQHAIDIETIKLVDSFEIDLHLKRDLPLFDHQLTRVCFSPVRVDMLEKFKNDWTRPEHFVGLGDFLPDSSTSQTQVILKRFRGSPDKFQTITYQVLTDPGTALNLYEKNKLDFVTLISEGDRPRARKLIGFFEHPIYMSTFLVLNPNKPPFDSLKNRKSFAASVDARKLVSVLGGARIQSPHWIPPSLMRDVGVGINPFPQWEKQSPPESPPPVDLVIHNSQTQKSLAENVQFQAKAHWNINIVVKDWAGYLKTINTDPTPIFRMAWAAFILHPSDFYQIWSTGHTLNRIQLSDPEYDRLSNLLKGETKPEKMVPLMEKMSRFLIREKVLIIPLFSESRTQLLRPDVKGYEILPFHTYDFSKAYRVSPSQ